MCPFGYDGKDCGHDIDDCASSPCTTGSTCIDKIAGYDCVCINGMTGKNCEIDIGEIDFKAQYIVFHIAYSPADYCNRPNDS